VGLVGRIGVLSVNERDQPVRTIADIVEGASLGWITIVPGLGAALVTGIMVTSSDS